MNVGGIVAVTAALIIATSLVLIASMPQPSMRYTRLYPWAFTGAYVEYVGSGNLQGVQITMNKTLRVLSMKGTLAQVLVVTNNTIGSNRSQIHRSFLWLPATWSDDSQFLSENGEVMTRYNTSIMIGGRMVPVTAYLIIDPARAYTYVEFLDRKLHFPVEEAVTVGLDRLNLMVVRTNIPGLPPDAIQN